MSNNPKKKFHTFTCYAAAKDEKTGVLTYFSGTDEVEQEVTIEVGRITAFQPQTVHSALFESHFTGSRVYMNAIPGVPFIVVKDTVEQLKEIVRNQ